MERDKKEEEEKKKDFIREWGEYCKPDKIPQIKQFERRKTDLAS